MQLTPREKDKLLIAMAAEVARKRLARGVKLNHPEAIALISTSLPIFTASRHTSPDNMPKRVKSAFVGPL